MTDINWDDDTPSLHANLLAVLDMAQQAGLERARFDSALMAEWHARLMLDLVLPDPDWAGCYRGADAARHIGVRIGKNLGVEPERVAQELQEFDAALARGIARLDAKSTSEMHSAEGLRELLTLCAWAHGQWVRIHPFTNGNGRTARLWVNAIAMRYGVPPFMKLRPRPSGPYAGEAAAAMGGDWKAILPSLHVMLDEELGR